MLAVLGCSNKPTEAPQATGQVFTQRCVICHQSNAQGIPGMYPPLADSVGYYVREPAGRQYLVHVLLNGLSGPIDVKGMTYNGLMPQFASLGDDEIAEALNEVLERYNSSELPADFKPIAPDEVHAGRALEETPLQLKTERSHIIDALKAAGAAK
ncbi:MAG TPA: cytochrome c [Candidatus Binataceae bacterium]|nr:cytochrome c [Candidatus Binataceae bacterium]